MKRDQIKAALWITIAFVATFLLWRNGAPLLAWAQANEYVSGVLPIAMANRFLWFFVGLFVAYRMLHHTQERLFGKESSFKVEVWDRIKTSPMAVAVFFSTQYAAALVAVALLARP